ncbi:hypothetical protein BDZ89DRAFT_596159 [Hymenopellis radicata]|nr:hypothetical protein BDZ89DRAFT_596159 [Hymenopellis radicata]
MICAGTQTFPSWSSRMSRSWSRPAVDLLKYKLPRSLVTYTPLLWTWRTLLNSHFRCERRTSSAPSLFTASFKSCSRQSVESSLYQADLHNVRNWAVFAYSGTTVEIPTVSNTKHHRRQRSRQCGFLGPIRKVLRYCAYRPPILPLSSLPQYLCICHARP